MKNKIEKEFTGHIKRIKNLGTLVVVEGKKDRKALESLGIKNIVELSKKPLFDLIENISLNNKDCILLTDLDKKGKELYGKLNSGLQKYGVRVDDKFRNFLFRHTKVRQIEGLSRF